MHNLDRTQLETGELEAEAEQSMNELLETLVGEDEAQGLASEASSPLGEMEELELTTELLEVQSEEELSSFLGGLFDRTARAVRGFAASPTGQQIKSTVTGGLADIAGKVLPIVGGAAGRAIAPRWGGERIGRGLASGIGALFGLELEGLSAEDREFELARQFVRFANAVCRLAAMAPPTAPPAAVVRTAFTRAAQQYAPGLVQSTPAAGPTGVAAPDGNGQGLNGTGGRGLRQGDSIVVFGA